MILNRKVFLETGRHTEVKGVALFRCFYSKHAQRTESHYLFLPTALELCVSRNPQISGTHATLIIDLTGMFPTISSVEQLSNHGSRSGLTKRHRSRFSSKSCRWYSSKMYTCYVNKTCLELRLHNFKCFVCIFTVKC